MFILSEYDKIIVLLLALVGGPDDTTAFPGLENGGSDPAFPVAVTACPRPIGRYEIEGKTIICGTVKVPENHATPGENTIDIVFTVLKSHSLYPEPDPLVHLHGGPGAGLLGGLEKFAELFDKWRANRDIVMFDQRAAGLSARSSDCYDAMTANIIDIIGIATEDSGQTQGENGQDPFGQCIEELRTAGIGLEYYNTEQNARDVAAIVRTLGYETFNLYGISYGTKLSLEVMRQHPEGLRAVVLDGVAPPSVHLYDTLAVPQNEAMITLVEECKADESCNKAYPDLGEKITEAYARAAAGEVIIDGEPMPPFYVGLIFSLRNGNYQYASYTAYIPAMIYEIVNGGDMPTLTMVLDKFKLVDGKPHIAFERPGAEEVSAAAKVARLNDEQERILQIALANTGLFSDSSEAMDLAIDELKGVLRRHRELGPLAELFDAELIKASTPIFADRSRAIAALMDLAALQNAEPSKERLQDFVRKHFEGDGQQRLSALISAMTEEEVNTSFDMVRTSVGRTEKQFVSDAHLTIYACQEDLPYNSIENYRELTRSLDYPQLGPTQWDAGAADFFEKCEQFEAKPRAGFHDPVVSDIPTLSLGSTWDTQTAASWAEEAVRTLSNGQAFIIPEAGHGAIVYQECAIDMGVAFINNPGRRLDNRCAESAKPTFYIAPWVEN
ncbi:alpha/beta hydrolase [Hoeflea sp. WL0058]|uniref:Proline iminopeptidase n=1 Tax=Flavimaribacter sediminis TaxID=2865987 RepID=A0AAE2ZRZ1_9HYPH|nr:alpha/beta hydrolase [Flavimaribacter sediminis]MBW8639418.1 alpha/beta hydrolase [Flavimaribacter sediminis]